MTTAEQIAELARDILQGNFYYGSQEDKLLLIIGLAELIDRKGNEV